MLREKHINVQTKEQHMDKDRLRKVSLQFWLIKNKEEAAHTIKQACYGFFLYAAFLIIVALFTDIFIMSDGIVFLVLAGLLFHFKSRVAAVLLLLLSTAQLIATILSYFGVLAMGSNILVAIVVFYIALSSTYAAFKYHK
jgi:hypothetical protein